ncbi:cytochrome P450 [Aspergillus foveolatus]|uniref:cytochrome P450 n=1 Tax=Aspergillus foveolatus TaxID=210207 RepID=UPI003CCCBE98
MPLPLSLILWPLLGFCLYVAIIATWYTFFSPLRVIPGPKSWTLFPILRHISAILGRFDTDMRRFHAQYGPVVRFGPKEVSFITADAWKTIYGHGHTQLPKYLHSAADPQSIISTNDTDHSRYRRALSYAFSAKGLQEQEPLIQSYVDKLVVRLKGVAESGRPEDMVKWYNLTTFDIIGDLAFGEPFGGLDSAEYHHWVSTIFQSVKVNPFILLKDNYPMLGWLLLRAFVPGTLRQAKKRQIEHSRVTVQKRLSSNIHTRPDFMDSMLRSRRYTYNQNDGEKAPDALTDSEIVSNSNILIIAGSETTATLLSGVTYWILRSPRVLSRVVCEVRSAMKSEADITIQKVSTELPYLLACFDEAFRLYPPVPTGLQRRTLAPTLISGYEIPPGTIVSVHQSGAYRSESNFHLPNNFIPERWLPDAKNNPSSPFYHDNRAVVQPFSVGPRNCIGRNLAFAEMRVILARVLWNFDLELCKESENWSDQKSYVLWEKGALMCRLKAREGI